MYIDLFEQFVEKKNKKKKRKKLRDADISNYEPPEYLVQPQEGETGFFLVKKEFDKMKRRYTPGISFSFADSDE